MSTQLIIVCSIGGIFLLIAIFYVSFVNETQSNKQAKKIATLSEKIRRYQSYLDCLPDCYLPKEVRLILIDEIIASLRTQLKLEPRNPRFNRLIEEMKTLQESVNREKAVPPTVGAINDIKIAKELQARLKSLFTVLTHIGKTRKQHTNAINKNLKLLKGIYVETAISVHKSTAERALQQGKTKLAVHHYNQIVGEYARNDAKMFAGKISETRAIIQKLDAQLSKEQASQKKASSAKEEEAAKDKKGGHGLDKMNSQDSPITRRPA